MDNKTTWKWINGKCSWAENGHGTWNGNFGTKEWNMKMAEQV